MHGLIRACCPVQALHKTESRQTGTIGKERASNVLHDRHFDSIKRFRGHFSSQKSMGALMGRPFGRYPIEYTLVSKRIHGARRYCGRRPQV